MFSAFRMSRYRKNSIRALEAAQNNLPHPHTSHQRPVRMQIITRDLGPDGLITPRPPPVSRATDSLQGPSVPKQMPRWTPSHDPVSEHTYDARDAHDTHNTHDACTAERYDDIDARLVAQAAVMEMLQSDVSDMREKLLHTEGCVRGRSDSMIDGETECALSERIGELETLLENHIRSDQELRRTVHEMWKSVEVQRRDQAKAHSQLLQRGSMLWLGTVGMAVVAQLFVGM